MDEESGGALFLFLGNCVDNLDILNYSIYMGHQLKFTIFLR